MHLTPLHDRIIVPRLVEEATPRRGAIVIPDCAREKPALGPVLVPGLGGSSEDGERLPMDVNDDVLATQERSL